jgi:Flp pilus assembly protein TadG
MKNDWGQCRRILVAEDDSMIAAALRRFARDRRANVAILFGLALVPGTFLVGMTVDYSSALQRQAKLQAAADAAVLSALTPAMLRQTDQAANTVATSTFNAQVATIKGLIYDSAHNLQVTVQNTGTTRIVTVSFAAASQIAFPKFLKQTGWALTGSSQGSASIAPNIDFYLLLDNSPSMAIAATTSGINTMVANTPDKCAFGCHETDKSPNDYYGLAQRLGVTLRIDMLRQATQNLMVTAQQTQQANGNQYRAAIYTFNIGFNTITALTSNLNLAQSQAGNISLYKVPYQNWSNDAITNYDNAMTNINSIMPRPGNGTKNNGDTPQEVLFFVTDGVEDEMVNGHRQQSLMDPAWCTTIKNRGIRIAVLYTTYLPLPTNAWYNTYIAPFQPQIGPTLQSCASPGLYFQVTTDQDISAAMKALFQQAVATAHLTR